MTGVFDLNNDKFISPLFILYTGTGHNLLKTGYNSPS
jgi:hypothetical protein